MQTPRILLKKVIQGIVRCYSSSNKIRVRFAPSPTGDLHLGGLRTALYNHLFAKSNNGVTILRIEDTDQARKVEGAIEKIEKDLEWCGITFDEGPYLQSERLHLYKHHAHELIDNGSAYRCFCTESRLELLRRENAKAGLPSRYDNKCRALSMDEVNNKLNKGHNFCVRFKLSDVRESCDDLIFGKFSSNVSMVEGDPVILKSDGYPTYHLANVVDDHLMNISHVLRGEEWQISTAKHLQLYRAFNWKPPQFGHLPLILNPNGTKLSKRQNDLAVNYIKNDGILPLALLNLVTRTGGGFDIDHFERDATSFTMEELIKKFDITKMNKTSCKLLVDKMLHHNRLEIKRIIASDINPLVSKAQDVIARHFAADESIKNLDLSDQHIRDILVWAQDRIYKLEDLTDINFKFIWVLPDCSKVEEGDGINCAVLEELFSELNKTEWELQTLKVVLKDFSQQQGIQFSKLMKLMRTLLCDIQQGPPVAEILDIIGKENSLLRMQKAIEGLKTKRIGNTG